MLKEAFANVLRIFGTGSRSSDPASRDFPPKVVLSLHDEEGKYLGSMRVSKVQLPAAATLDKDASGSRFNDPRGLRSVFRVTVGQPARTKIKAVMVNEREYQYDVLLADGKVGTVIRVESNEEGSVNQNGVRTDYFYELKP
ncbi:hypothetical protein ACFW0H_14995 [Pseudomonas sp. CR3202]|uniref:hypothetical protein n=1 Tax=Pseudomonas sp. CR3202 TaxID=3351532 RepID=UPI003BF100C0